METSFLPTLPLTSFTELKDGLLLDSFTDVYFTSYTPNAHV